MSNYSSPIQAYNALKKIDYSGLKKHIDSEELNGNSFETVLDETLKFWSMCATMPGSFAPSKAIDEIWHAAILETELYAQVTEKLGVFIHHDRNVPKYAPHFDSTVVQVQNVFGNAPTAVWNGYANCGYGGCGAK